MRIVQKEKYEEGDTLLLAKCPDTFQDAACSKWYGKEVKVLKVLGDTKDPIYKLEEDRLENSNKGWNWYSEDILGALVN